MEKKSALNVQVDTICEKINSICEEHSLAKCEHNIYAKCEKKDATICENLIWTLFVKIIFYSPEFNF